MEGFREIFSTNNHIQLNQIEQALQNAGIVVVIKGRKALEIGNIELTGIRGAQVMVEEQKFNHAKEVLKALDIDTDEDKISESGAFNMVYLLAIFFVLVILYMIYAAYFK